MIVLFTLVAYRQLLQETTQRRSSSAKLLALGVKLRLQSLQDCVNGHRDASPVVLLGRSLCLRMERGLDEPESDGVPHSRLDEFGQGLALPQNGLEFCAQLWFDADLRYGIGLHG